MPDRPTVVVLCGSTRFRREYQLAFSEEEHAGRICLTVPCYKDDPCCKSPEDHARLDALHRHKIDMAKDVLVIAPKTHVCQECRKPCVLETVYAHERGYLTRSDCCKAGRDWVPYIGDSTQAEIAYAEAAGKKVRYWRGPTQPPAPAGPGPDVPGVGGGP